MFCSVVLLTSASLCLSKAAEKPLLLSSFSCWRGKVMVNNTVTTYPADGQSHAAAHRGVPSLTVDGESVSMSMTRSSVNYSRVTEFRGKNERKERGTGGRVDAHEEDRTHQAERRCGFSSEEGGEMTRHMENTQTSPTHQPCVCRRGGSPPKTLSWSGLNKLMMSEMEEDTRSNISMQRKFCVTVFGLLCTQQHQQSQWQSSSWSCVHNNPNVVFYLGWNVPAICFKKTWNGGTSCDPDQDGTLGCSFAPGLENLITIAKLHFNFHLNFLSRTPKQQRGSVW